ncbi:MAG: H-NS histone family protein [Methylococcales bacterium]
MKENFEKLSEVEIRNVIKDAEKALKGREDKKRKEVLAQIKELAGSIGVSIEIKEGAKKLGRRGAKVAVKFRNPDNDAETWTGRGITPRWLKGLLDNGRDLSEFEV